MSPLVFPYKLVAPNWYYQVGIIKVANREYGLIWHTDDDDILKTVNSNRLGLKYAD